MSTRIDLYNELKKACSNIYFDPPESLKMKYPCIVYSRDNSRTKYGDDKVYVYRQGYQVTVIDKNPDSPIPESLLYSLSMISFQREFVADNLHHTVFQVYY